MSTNGPKERLVLEGVQGGDPEVERWLSALGDCRSRTLRALEPLSDSDLDRVESGGGNTVGTVAGLKLSEHLDRLAAVRAMVTEALTGMSPQEFHRARSLPDHDVSPDWVVHHLMQHEAEHRGQIAELLGRSE